MIKGFFIILACLAAGNMISMLVGHFIPGSVCGMMLLFLLLATKAVNPDSVRKPAEFLTKNMTVLFIPASIGIMEQWGLIKNCLTGWLAVIFFSTVLVIMTAGLVQDGFIYLSGRIKNKGK